MRKCSTHVEQSLGKKVTFREVLGAGLLFFAVQMIEPIDFNPVNTSC
jgi:hypothetical protein